MIDKVIIIFIHSWLVSMVTDERESHMLHHDIWLLWTFLQPRILMIFLISTAEKSDGERVKHTCKITLFPLINRIPFIIAYGQRIE